MNDQKLDRRSFLKLAAMTGATLGLESVLGCATTETKELAAPSKPVEPVIYPKLSAKKIQPPENGCLMGFRRVYALSMPDEYKKKWGEITNKSDNIDDIARSFNEPQWDEVLSKTIGGHIDYYEQALGKKPAIFVFFETPKLFLNFPTQQVSQAVSKGVVPYVNLLPLWEQKARIRVELKDIAKGKYNRIIEALAEGAANFGKQYGGFFASTLHEMNGFWYYWSQSSKFKDSWRRIVDIFEDKGANQYATWVWHIACPEAHPSGTDHPDRYYPGDAYVDWIGFSAYNRRMIPATNGLFDALVGKSYADMRKNHQSKPIMMSEFGKTTGWDQARWIRDAYHSLKQMPGMKAANLWHHVSKGPMSPGIEGDDKSLTQESLSALREIVKDPYFIMAKQ